MPMPPQNKVAESPNCPLVGSGGRGATLGPADGQIAAPGAFTAAGSDIPVTEVDLEDFAAQRYPGLMRAQLTTVYRPWRISDPLWGTVAWRIRCQQARILRLPEDQVVASHAMIYAGGGNYWSQGPKFTLERIEEYRGCDLFHWDLGWDMATRNALMGECGPHANERYAYRDIAALALWSITGRQGWLETIGDPEHLFCSERVCQLVRQIQAAYTAGPDFLGGRACEVVVPQLLHMLLIEVRAACVAVRPV
jgi:hypothetical protein